MICDVFLWPIQMELIAKASFEIFTHQFKRIQLNLSVCGNIKNIINVVPVQIKSIQHVWYRNSWISRKISFSSFVRENKLFQLWRIESGARCKRRIQRGFTWRKKRQSQTSLLMVGRAWIFRQTHALLQRKDRPTSLFTKASRSKEGSKQRRTHTQEAFCSRSSFFAQRQQLGRARLVFIMVSGCTRWNSLSGSPCHQLACF